eukprot:jgi/Botrbrau1/1887/Bobra.0005s0004.1
MKDTCKQRPFPWALAFVIFAMVSAEDEIGTQVSCKKATGIQGNIGEQLSVLQGSSAGNLDQCAEKCIATPNCTVFLYCNTLSGCASSDASMVPACFLARGPVSPESSESQPLPAEVTVGICGTDLNGSKAKTTNMYRWDGSFSGQDNRTEGIVLSEKSGTGNSNGRT